MAVRIAYDDRKRLIQIGIGAAILVWVLVDAARGGSGWSRVGLRLPLLRPGSGGGWRCGVRPFS